MVQDSSIWFAIAKPFVCSSVIGVSPDSSAWVMSIAAFSRSRKVANLDHLARRASRTVTPWLGPALDALRGGRYAPVWDNQSVFAGAAFGSHALRSRSYLHPKVLSKCSCKSALDFSHSETSD